MCVFWFEIWKWQNVAHQPAQAHRRTKKKKKTNKPKTRKKKIGNHTPNSSNFRLLAEAISYLNRSYFMCVMCMRINVMIHNGKVFCTVKKNEASMKSAIFEENL